jgi:hypothetical protein
LPLIDKIAVNALSWEYIIEHIQFSENKVGEKTTYEGLYKDKNRIEEVTNITEWIYDRGLGIVILTFEGSRLVKKEYNRK